ncbi:uncharacterized mitochondrial protein-like protein [Tanacetum coccineum]
MGTKEKAGTIVDGVRVTAAKAYNMLRQEEKQRESQKQHITTPIAPNTYKYPYTPFFNPPQRNNNSTLPNTQSERRSTFGKGVLCAYYKKEDHLKEEFYKLLGYPVSQTSSSSDPSSSLSSPLEPTSISTPLEALVYARMDKLQNQLNQVLMMMQSNQSDSAGTFMPHVQVQAELCGHFFVYPLNKSKLYHPLGQGLSQFLQEPTILHMKALIKFIEYVKLTLSHKLFLPTKNTLQMTTYCDSDWASYPFSRRSVTGYGIYFGSSLISWQSKKQTLVSRSLTEAECRALVDSTCEVT